MTTTCEHTPGGDCCNRDDLACPSHFTQLVASFMDAVARDDQPTARSAAADLNLHGWTTPAVMTWCGLIHGYAQIPGQSREDVMARITTNTDDLSPADRAEREGWIFRLGVLARAAVAGDGDMIDATIATVAADPYMTPRRTLSLVASLANATYTLVEADPRITAQTVATYAILGSQTRTAAGFSMLHPMADLMEAIRLDQTDRPEVAARFTGIGPVRMLTGVTIAARALGQLIDPEDVMLVSTTGIGETAAANVTGIVQWRDPTLDGSLNPEALAAARAMRVAHAFGTGRRQEVINLLKSSDDHPAYARDVIVGCCTILALMVAAQNATA